MSNNYKICEICSRFSSGDTITAASISDKGKYPVYGGNGIRGFSDKSNFKGKCFLIGRQGANSGNVRFFSGEGFISEHAIVGVTNEKANTKYLASLLSIMDLSKYQGQSAQPGLSVKTLSEINISLPERRIQDAVAEILTRIDSKIETNNAIISELESMARDIYDYWFVQFDFPDENGKPYKSSGGKMVWNEELKREIPEGWKAKTLNQSYKITRGISYTSGDIATGQGVPMVNLACVDINRNYRPGELKYYNGPLSEEMKLKPGEMVIACTDLTRNRDIIGCPILIPEGNVYTFSMDMAKIESCDLEIENMYLYMTLRTDSYHSFIKQWASGTTVLHLNLDGINWYPICIPPVSLQKKLSELVLECHLKKCICLQENAELTSLREFLLPLMMNGQVKIGDVEP